MEVVFYKSTADNRRLDKTTAIHKLYGVVAHLKETTSILNPTFIIANNPKLNLSQVNYMYVPELGRYYFITDIATMTSNRLAITGHVDVLMTYKDAISAKKCLIERSEDKYNPYIVDDELKVRTEREYQVVTLGSFGAPTGSYFALTVNGGV